VPFDQLNRREFIHCSAAHRRGFNTIAPDRRNDPEFGKIGIDRIVAIPLR
jgi:hypothetical protein